MLDGMVAHPEEAPAFARTQNRIKVRVPPRQQTTAAVELVIGLSRRASGSQGNSLQESNFRIACLTIRENRKHDTYQFETVFYSLSLVALKSFGILILPLFSATSSQVAEVRNIPSFSFKCYINRFGIVLLKISSVLINQANTVCTAYYMPIY